MLYPRCLRIFSAQEAFKPHNNKTVNMKKPLTKLLTSMAVGMGVLAAAPSALAVATLTVFDGTTLVTVTDNGAGDLNVALGAVAVLYAPAGSAWAGNIEAG